VARERALRFGWGRAAQLFGSFLVPLPRRARSQRDAQAGSPARLPEPTKLSHKRHPAVE
jgi:hypothetical protein